jgi:hypothetical protein
MEALNHGPFDLQIELQLTFACGVKFKILFVPHYYYLTLLTLSIKLMKVTEQETMHNVWDEFL